jgi:hypothetical protein
LSILQLDEYFTIFSDTIVNANEMNVFAHLGFRQGLQEFLGMLAKVAIVDNRTH